MSPARVRPVVVLLLALVCRCSGSRLLPIISGAMLAERNDNGGAAAEQVLEDEPLAGNGTMRCDDARLRCAYRTGCGMALQHYLTRCASVLQGSVNDCPEVCQHALIALTSTDEGKELMKCECAKDDRLCQHSKQRAEICRSSVTSTMNRKTVSCRVATWICNADAICSTALQYYHDNCKRMFHGKKCTKRCRNSLSILRRQEKAAKLNTCFCDGAEEYDCKAIHRNMAVLCYGKPYREYQPEVPDSPRPDDNSVPDNQDDNKGQALSPARTILLLCLVLLLLNTRRG